MTRDAITLTILDTALLLCAMLFLTASIYEFRQGDFDKATLLTTIAALDVAVIVRARARM